MTAACPRPNQDRHDHNRGIDPPRYARASPAQIEAAIRARHRETLRMARDTPWLIGGPVSVANAIAWAEIGIRESLARVAADAAEFLQAAE